MVWSRDKLITLEFEDGVTCDVRVRIPSFEDVQKFVEEKWTKIETFKRFVLSVEGLSEEELKDIEKVPGAFSIINPVSDWIVSQMAFSPSLKKK